MQKRRTAVNDVDLSELIDDVLQNQRPVLAETVHLIEEQMRVAMLAKILDNVLQLMAREPQVVKTGIKRPPRVFSVFIPQALTHKSGFPDSSCTHYAYQSVAPINFVRNIAIED